jgi:hypothetical protein
MRSESGCWKQWDTEKRLCLTLRVVMEDGRSKFLKIRLDSGTKEVTLSEVMDHATLPTS